MYPWSSWRTLFPLLTGVAGTIVFGIYQWMLSRRAFDADGQALPGEHVEPITRLSIFRNLSQVIMYASTVHHGIVLWSLLYFPASVLRSRQTLLANNLWRRHPPGDRPRGPHLRARGLPVHALGPLPVGAMDGLALHDRGVGPAVPAGPCYVRTWLGFSECAGLGRHGHPVPGHGARDPGRLSPAGLRSRCCFLLVPARLWAVRWRGDQWRCVSESAGEGVAEETGVGAHGGGI